MHTHKQAALYKKWNKKIVKCQQKICRHVHLIYLVVSRIYRIPWIKKNVPTGPENCLNAHRKQL